MADPEEPQYGAEALAPVEDAPAVDGDGAAPNDDGPGDVADREERRDDEGVRRGSRWVPPPDD